jgi:integrase
MSKRSSVLFILVEASYKVLSPEEVLRLIDHASCERDKFFITLLFKTGMRFSEACGLKLNQFKVSGDEHFVIIHGKGDKTRTV